MMTMVQTRQMSRVVRAADWPASLHAACDRHEAAGDAMLAFGLSPEAFEAASAAFNEAKKTYGRECLLLDKQRRPAVYGLSATSQSGRVGVAPTPQNALSRIERRRRIVQARKRRIASQGGEDRLRQVARVLVEKLVNRLEAEGVADTVRRECEDDVVQALRLSEHSRSTS